MPKVTSLSDERTVDATMGEPLKEVCDREILGVPFSCRNGVCGTCTIKITKGKENLNPKQANERETLAMLGAAEEHRLACQCMVQGDVEFDSP